MNTDCLETFLVQLKGLLKGFLWPFRSLKSVKYSQSYGPNEVCDKVISAVFNIVVGIIVDFADARPRF